ncbi:MAG: vWA domain-containing protein [Gammaproteobacteria bacterium]
MKRNKTADPAAQNRDAAWALVGRQPVLAPLLAKMTLLLDHDYRVVGEKGWFAVSSAGRLWLHPKRRAEVPTWTRVIALAAACLGFGLVRRRTPQEVWELAALLVADRFCTDLKIGQWPEELFYAPPPLPSGGEDSLFQQLCTTRGELELLGWRQALSGSGRSLFIESDVDDRWYRPPKPPEWKKLLAEGIAQGVGDALQVAATGDTTARQRPDSIAQRAKRRLIDAYPLLGALAAGFALEEDPRICRQYDIQVAAIDVGARTIWMNPAAGLAGGEALFVFAHELLHAGLNHASRRRGRDAYLWNVACDFTINGWLKEMGVGTPPRIGVLYDVEFDTLSAEDIYDRLAQDLRRGRKLATLRGAGMPDLLGDDSGDPFIDAESYCRRALAQGLERHLFSGSRGLLPAGLIEEIRSLSQPPIPWDVRLAEWFDAHFPTPERRRSYARPSRRQASTPDIPRPSVVPPSPEQRKLRVFGVLLDTSGSMPPQLLGKALGAIASYSLAREVYAVRLVCCDAAAHDSGWVEPERLLDRFAVNGRGGTVLQPGIELLRGLARRGEFPHHGPLLTITDGYCEERLDIPFEHAFLLPAGRRLPFAARGEVFWVV